MKKYTFILEVSGTGHSCIEASSLEEAIANFKIGINIEEEIGEWDFCEIPSAKNLMED